MRSPLFRLLACTTLLAGAALSWPDSGRAATQSGCLARIGAKGSKAYSSAVAEASRCSRGVAKGLVCNEPARDALLQSLLGQTQSQLLAACNGVVAASLGFSSDDDLVIGVAGAGVGEGRDVVDRIYGRTPGALSDDLQRCADKAVKKASSAGKALIKSFAKCRSSCPSSTIAKIDKAFDRARSSIQATCSPSEFTLLTGGDVTGYLASVRVGAQRVVDATRPSAKPVVSVVTPTVGSIVTPPGLPVTVTVTGRVVNVPSTAYVTRFEINGQAATVTPGGDFTAAILVSNPTVPSVPFVLKARTTRGVFVSATHVKINLNTLAPDVAITAPLSGVITAGTSVVVSGNVLGNLAQASTLTVGGVPTSFHPTTGAFSRTVTLGTEPVQVIEAEVHATGLGVTRHDSVVVLRGLAQPIGTPLIGSVYDRLNNSALTAVQGNVQAVVDPAFDPEEIIGTELDGGGTVCGFEAGSRSMTVRAVANQTLRSVLDIGAPFHVKLCDAPTPVGSCTVDYRATHVKITTDMDLADQLVATLTDFQAAFTGGSGVAFGVNPLCAFLNLFDIETTIQEGLAETFQEKIPEGVNSALSGIELSGSALGVDFEATFGSIDEDANGVRIEMDADVTAAPAPDAPVITHTLAPLGAAPPALGTSMIGGGAYDLGVCFTDAFFNRALAAFMLAGEFNKSIDELPAPIGPIKSESVSGIFGDPAYSAACPNCPVTLALRPTAAAVVRRSAPGEDGDLILTIPNYRLELIADDAGTPFPLVAALVVVEVPLRVSIAAGAIVPTTGAVAAPVVRVVENHVAANEVAFENQVSNLFPLASSQIAALLGEIRLPEFENVSLTPLASAYDNSCLALYADLAPAP